MNSSGVNNTTVYSESGSTILFYLVKVVHQLVLAGECENLFLVIIKLIFAIFHKQDFDM
jgi:hypothetical protein